jgi:hypothetical protein
MKVGWTRDGSKLPTDSQRKPERVQGYGGAEGEKQAPFGVQEAFEGWGGKRLEVPLHRLDRQSCFWTVVRYSGGPLTDGTLVDGIRWMT